MFSTEVKLPSREQNLASRGQRKITLFTHKANIHTVHKQNLGIKVSQRDQLQKMRKRLLTEGDLKKSVEKY